MARMYILYDGRAAYDPDEASVIGVADTPEEAESYKDDYDDLVCYSYEKDSEGNLTDPQYEWCHEG